MKSWENFTVLAVAARQLRQTQQKRVREFDTLVPILLPSFTSNSVLRHRRVPVFAMFAGP